MAENKPTNRERLREITDGIEQDIKELFESEKYMRYLSVMSRFHRYSVNNTMLIYMQKSEATLVAGYNKWKNQFERHVKKGERGITIIAPTPYKKKIEEQKLDPDTNAPILDKDGKVITEEKEIEIPMFRPVIPAGEDRSLSAQIHYYVAECMEFPNLGEYHDNLSLDEAIRFYQEIPAERMNWIKGIGFDLQDGSDYEGTFPILMGKTIDLDTIQTISYYRDNPLVQKAVRELIAAMPEMEVIEPNVQQMQEQVSQQAEENAAPLSQLPGDQEQALDEYPMPDPALTQDDLEKCSYLDSDLLPLSKERAYELMERDLTVYMIQEGENPEMAFDSADLDAHDGIFAVDREEWEKSEQFHEKIMERQEHQQEREQAFLAHKEDCFAIYQVSHDDPQNVRFMNLDGLRSKGISLDRSMCGFLTINLLEIYIRKAILQQMNRKP